MPRLPHGLVVTPGLLQAARKTLAQRNELLARGDVRAFAAAEEEVELHKFDFLFPELQEDPDNLLEEGPGTVSALKQLSFSMVDLNRRGDDSPIPAAYTYFGQFVDHDITLEVQPADLPPSASGSVDVLVNDPHMAPLPADEIPKVLRNFRTATLDLDSLYGTPAPRDPNNGDKMLIGTVTPLNSTKEPLIRPPGKGDDNDLPREPRSADILHDRAAMIGDPRNDENLIVAQLHLAFLKAHNRLVYEGNSFEEARRILRQHYQHIIVHDFLKKRVADPYIVDDILAQDTPWYGDPDGPVFMPLEFSVAAYRFGHTMVRAAYDFNTNFNFEDARNDPTGQRSPATLELLFTFTALSGQFMPAPGVDFPTLPENWIIEWENIIGDGPKVNKARRFDPQLSALVNGEVKALFNLHNLQQNPEPGLAARLAVRNLLRGYRLRLPTGQAVADRLGIQVLTPDEIRAAAPDQEQALEAGGFLDRTPLWFYLLAEARHHGGEHLGPLGSTIVAGVLISLIRRSADSILGDEEFTPSLPAATEGTFELADLLRFAGVLPEEAAIPGPRAPEEAPQRVPQP